MMLEKIIPRGTVSVTVLTQMYSQNNIKISQNSMYHLLPIYAFENCKTQNSWLIVMEILDKNLSKNKILDIGLPYFEEQTSNIYRGRYIFYNNRLFGVKIDTSKQPFWTRHLVKKAKVPKKIEHMCLRQEDKFYFVGQFSLRLANTSIGLLSGSQYRESGLIGEYQSYGFDLIVICDQTENEDFVEKLKETSLTNQINFIYGNIQNKTKSDFKVGGAAIIENGAIINYQKTYSYLPNPIIEKQIDLSKTRKRKNISFDNMTIQLLFPVEIQKGDKLFLFNEKVREQMYEQGMQQIKAIDALTKYKFQIWDLYKKNQCTPFVCEWIDNPKNIVFIYLISSLAEDLDNLFNKEQQAALIGRPIKNNSILLEMLVVYSLNQTLQLNQLDFLKIIRQKLESNFVLEKNTNEKMFIVNKLQNGLNIIEKTLPYVLDISNKSRYMIYTDSKQIVNTLKVLNEIHENIIFMSMDFLQFDAAKVIFKQFLPQKNEGVLRTILAKYAKNIPIQNELIKYFNQLEIEKMLKNDLKFNPLRFKESLSKKPDFNVEYFDYLYEIYIPKLLANPINFTKQEVEYFLFTAADVKKLHSPLYEIYGTEFIKLKSIKQYNEEIIKILETQRKCHKCNYNYEKNLGVFCSSVSCNKFYCFKCLNEYKRFDEFVIALKLDDCPACLKQCRCWKCLKADENKKIKKQKKKKDDSRIPCHLCQESDNIRSNCDNCSAAFCMKCLRKTFGLTNSAPLKQWTCFICKQICTCKICQLKKQARLLQQRNTKNSQQEFQFFINKKNQVQKQTELKKKQSMTLMQQYQQSKKIEEEQKKKKKKQIEIQKNFQNSFGPVREEGTPPQNTNVNIDSQYNKYFKKPVNQIQPMTFEERFKHPTNSQKPFELQQKQKMKIYSIWNQSNDDQVDKQNNKNIFDDNKNYQRNNSSSYDRPKSPLRSNVNNKTFGDDSWRRNRSPPRQKSQEQFPNNNNNKNYNTNYDRNNNFNQNFRNNNNNRNNQRSTSQERTFNNRNNNNIKNNFNQNENNIGNNNNYSGNSNRFNNNYKTNNRSYNSNSGRFNNNNERDQGQNIANFGGNLNNNRYNNNNSGGGDANNTSFQSSTNERYNRGNNNYSDRNQQQGENNERGGGGNYNKNRFANNNNSGGYNNNRNSFNNNKRWNEDNADMNNNNNFNDNNTKNNQSFKRKDPRSNNYNSQNNMSRKIATESSNNKEEENNNKLNTIIDVSTNSKANDDFDY